MQENQVYNLCFADDLLIFTKGNLDSIIRIQNILKLFYSFYGLQINYAKCELFSTGVSKDVLLEIQQHSGFKLGMLPVRYLGVPLVTRRLTNRDCALLVEKITIRIKFAQQSFSHILVGFSLYSLFFSAFKIISVDTLFYLRV